MKSVRRGKERERKVSIKSEKGLGKKGFKKRKRAGIKKKIS